MLKKILTTFALVMFALLGQAQSLSALQLDALKAAIVADSALTQWRAARRDDLIAAYYNEPASPTFTIWRRDVTAEEIGNAWVGTDIDGMSALNMQRLQLMFASRPSGLFDMTRADLRAAFENPFGTNQNNASRVAMRTVWKRTINRVERLFATGTGSDATPGVAPWYGTIDTNVISNLLN